VTRLGIFRSGQWFIDNQNPLASGFTGSHNTFSTFLFGLAGDIPIVSNWAGGAADNIGIYRQGLWVVDSNGDNAYQLSDSAFTYGSAGDIPVVGNWNGVTPKRIGVFSGAGQWFLDINGDHIFSLPFDVIANFGQPGDLPVVAGPGSIVP
jgi:hypothetical protein